MIGFFMKRSFHKFSIIAVFLAISLALESCELFDRGSESEDDKLPKATQSGKNTFGCLVNGKVWVTETTTDASAFYQDGVLLISATLETISRDQGISFYIYDQDLAESNYPLQEHIDQFSSFANFGDDILDCGFETTSSHNGNIIITHLDQTNFIISGTFEFEAYSDDCDKVMKITKGRFDLNYAP